MKYIKGLLGIVLFCVVSLGLSFELSDFSQQDIFQYSGLSQGLLSCNHKGDISYQYHNVFSSLSLGQDVFAQNKDYYGGELPEVVVTPKEQNKGNGIVDILNDILRMLYLVLWPLLFIAGLAVDNSLVYGSVFNFDKILWEIWNIMRDLANFSLFFIALYHIVKYLYQNKVNEIQGVVKKLLIAGVLIQVSWFLMGAIIDISTISIVGVGSLPSVASSNNSNDAILQTPILQPHIISYNTSEDGRGKQQTFRYFSYGEKNIAECWTHAHQHRYYIVGRQKFLPGETNETIKFSPNVCSDGRSVYQFKEQVGGNTLKEYKDEIDVLTREFKTDGFLLMQRISFVATGDYSSIGVYPDDHEFFITQRQNGGKTVKKVLREAKGYVGPFITLYSSLLGYADLGAKDVVKTGDNYRMFGDFIRKTVFALLLFIPLVAMVVILILRVGVLWLAIVFLPFLVIKWVFFKESKTMDFVDTHFKRPNLLSIIFAPVIMVFALSLSIIFIHAVTEDIDKNVTESEFATKIITCEQGQTCECPGGKIDFFGLISLCDKGGNINAGKNIFAEIIENLFALGVMWFLLFAALKTNSIGSKIGGAIQKTAQKALGTIPILPVAGGIGWNTFKNQIVDARAVDTIVTQRNTQDMNKLKKVLPGVFGSVKTSLQGLDTNTSTNLYWQRAGGATGAAMIADSDTLKALNAGGTNIGRGDGKLLEEKLDAELKQGLQGEKFDKHVLDHMSEGKEAKALFEDKQYIYELNKRNYGQNDDERFVNEWEKKTFGETFDDTSKVDAHLRTIETDITDKKQVITDIQNDTGHTQTELDTAKSESETLEKKKKYLEHKRTTLNTPAT